MPESINLVYETLDERNTYEPGELYFNDWEIEGELGGGSYGTVYRLRKTDYGIALESAMKVIRIPSDANEQRALLEAGMSEGELTAMNARRVEDAAREIRTMVELRGHPNVVRCEDFRVFKYQDADLWDILIRMELLKPLTEVVKARGATAELAVSVGIAVARALEACEARHLLHRDIKPGNIFADENPYDGSVAYKLGDFGMSRVSLGGTTAMTQKGTELYMAPEVMVKDRYDSRADLYSLGLVLYQLANNNRLPFFPQEGEAASLTATGSATMKRLMNTPLPAPANADERLAAIILKVCAYEPDERYATAKELREALEGYQRSAPAAGATAVASEDYLAVKRELEAVKREQAEMKREAQELRREVVELKEALAPLQWREAGFAAKEEAERKAREEAAGTAREAERKAEVKANRRVKEAARKITDEIPESWEEIIAAIHNGTAKKRYAVGAWKPLDMGKFGTINMQLAGFDLDERADGKGKAATTWIARELLPEKRRMNPELSGKSGQRKKSTGSIGGWEYCEMRAYLQYTVFPMLPSAVQDDLTSVKKQQESYNTAGNEFVQTTEDRIWIPSYKEVFGSDSLYVTLFQNDKDKRRKADSSGSTADWWLRSANGNYGFGAAGSNGFYHFEGAYSSGGVVFGFCI